MHRCVRESRYTEGVISDSVVVKRDLAHQIAGLRELVSDWEVEESDTDGADIWDDPWEERPSLEMALLEVERVVFWSAFSIRKLIEARKLSDEFEAQTVPVLRFPRREPAQLQDQLNAHHIDRHYDLDNSDPTFLTPIELCNQLIHSFVFVPCTDKASRQMTGILFNSDRSRDTSLFHVTWSDFEAIVISAAEDDVVYAAFDRRSNSWVKSRHGL